MASYPPIFVVINGILLNATDIQTARWVEASANEPAGVLVHFISGGWVTVPAINLNEFEDVVASAARAAAPF